MDILLSWSRPVSHDIALALKDWLPQVLPGCNPWVSSEDIAKGKLWWDELHGFLGSVKVALIIVTPENAQSPWLYYEAGAIAAKLSVGASVCPYLVGVPIKLIQGTPLSPFQCTEADKADTLKLIRSLNRGLAVPHDAGLIDGTFNTKWSQLKRKLEKAAESLAAIEDPVEKTEPPLSQQLSADAVVILQTACKAMSHTKGRLIRVDASNGLTLQAGDYAIEGVEDVREQARWEAALEELEQFGLIKASTYKREGFTVTYQGFQVYDELGAAPEGDPWPTPAPQADLNQ